MKSHKAIYIPGLGDSRTYNQDKALGLWKYFGIEVEYFALGWADKELFKPKLSRLLARIDYLKEQGYSVSLIGPSAGASAVLNAYALRKHNIHKVICISGKIQNAQTISEHMYKENPAFRGSMKMLADSLATLKRNNLQRIMCLRPLFDNIVPVKDAVINGANNRVIPVLGHSVSILFAITLGAPYIANFIKRMS